MGKDMPDENKKPGVYYYETNYTSKKSLQKEKKSIDDGPSEIEYAEYASELTEDYDSGDEAPMSEGVPESPLNDIAEMAPTEAPTEREIFLTTQTGRITLNDSVYSKLKGKSIEAKKMKDPYLSIIQNEYKQILSDSEKYGITISDDIKTQLRNGVDSLNKIEEDIKKLFDESNKKQEETKKILSVVKEEISEVLNAKKYTECMSKAEEFIKAKSYNNARSCYDNALYYTKSKKEEVTNKLKELKVLESKAKINRWVNDINYYMTTPNNNQLNRIVEQTYSIDLKSLDDNSIAAFKLIYTSIANSKKVNLISSILDNPTFSADVKLGIL